MKARDYVFAYRVTSFWGCMVGRIAVDEIILEQKATPGKVRHWNVINLDSGQPIGGWSGEKLGKIPRKKDGSLDPDVLVALKGGAR